MLQYMFSILIVEIFLTLQLYKIEKPARTN